MVGCRFPCPHKKGEKLEAKGKENEEKEAEEEETDKKTLDQVVKDITLWRIVHRGPSRRLHWMD